MARTVVGLFNSSAEAQQAIEQLLTAGFTRSNLNVATRNTLQAQHLPATADCSTPTESLEEGIVRFFTNLFAGNEDAQAQAHIAAASPDSAVVTANAATDEEAEHARATLDANGAIDVYKQAQTPAHAYPHASRADDIIDLEGSVSRVRDDDELDANGLTTH